MDASEILFNKETISFLSKNFTGFGTGPDEFAYERESIIELYRRDINDLNSCIVINIHIIGYKKKGC